MPGPLVLLHGFSGAPASWDEVVARLSTERAVLRPALLGHAPERVDAELAQPPASFDDAVDRVAAELRALGIGGGAHLVGYSLGARTGLGLLVRHRVLFSRATLIGVNPGLEDEGARAERAAGDERLASLAERDLPAFVARWEAVPLFATQRRLPDSVVAAQRRQRLSHRGEGLALSLRCMGLARMPSYWAALPALDLPVHLVAGADDAKFRALAERARAALPQARVSIAAGAGHNVVLESPAVVAAIASET